MFIAVLWLVVLALDLVRGASGISSGVARSNVAFFEHGTLVNVTFGVLAVALLLAALTSPPKRLLVALAVWLVLQSVHLAYHLYDLETLRPEVRVRVMGAFAAQLAMATFLLWLLASAGVGRRGNTQHS